MLSNVLSNSLLHSLAASRTPTLWLSSSRSPSLPPPPSSDSPLPPAGLHSHCWTDPYLTSTPSALWRTGSAPSRWASTETTSSTQASPPCSWWLRWPQSEFACLSEIKMLPTRVALDGYLCTIWSDLISRVCIFSLSAPSDSSQRNQILTCVGAALKYPFFFKIMSFFPSRLFMHESICNIIKTCCLKCLKTLFLQPTVTNPEYFNT